MNVIERFTRFYQNVDEQAIASLDQIYSEEVEFVDPVARHTGLHALTLYFKNLMENAQTCQCQIQCILSDQNKHMVTWEMNFTHPKLNSGSNIRVEGVTELHVKDDIIVFHRDYYDMGQMIYEQIPFLKTVVNGVKKRLAQ